MLLVLVASCARPVRYDLPPLPSTTPTSSQDLGAISIPGRVSAPEPTVDNATPTTSAVTLAWVPASANLVGLPSECGNVSLVTARPEKDVVMVSVAQQGLWANDGTSDEWNRLGGGRGSAQITNRGSSMVFDPATPDRFWQSGTYNGASVLRTDDGGTTWTALGNVPWSDRISVDLTDPQRRTLLSATHERTEVYRSTDGGATWVDVAGGLPQNVGVTGSVYVIDARTFLIGSKQAAGAGIYRSTDAGASWTQVFSGAMAGGVLASERNGGLFWMLDGGRGLLKSTDQGASWKGVSGSRPFAPLVADLIEMPDGRLAAAGRTVVVSDDGGVGWKPIGPPLPIEATGLAYAPGRQAFYAWKFDCDLGGARIPSRSRRSFGWMSPRSVEPSGRPWSGAARRRSSGSRLGCTGVSMPGS